MKRYRFRDEWTVDASPEQVWKLISDPSTYPLWWPIYQEARFLEDRGGPGSTILLKFRVLLPYSLTVVSTITRSEEPSYSEGTVDGELQGTWSWSLTTTEQGGTRVVFSEEVGTNKRALDLLAPLASRLFALNHRIAARRGARGMQEFFRRQRATPAAGG